MYYLIFGTGILWIIFYSFFTILSFTGLVSANEVIIVSLGKVVSFLFRFPSATANTFLSSENKNVFLLNILGTLGFIGIVISILSREIIRNIQGWRDMFFYMPIWLPLFLIISPIIFFGISFPNNSWQVLAILGLFLFWLYFAIFKYSKLKPIPKWTDIFIPNEPKDSSPIQVSNFKLYLKIFLAALAIFIISLMNFGVA